MTICKYSYLILLPLLGLSAQSDKNEKDSDSESVRDFYHYRIGDVKEVDALIAFGLGEMTIAPNSHSKRFDGSVEYVPALNKPEITYEEQGGKGILSINQKSDIVYRNENFTFGDFNDENMTNVGNFLLPPDVGLNTEIEFGLGEAELDFTGLNINSLNIECGLGEMDISVDRANQIEAEYLLIGAGLGEVDGHKLGNLRAKSVSIDVGLGEADIDMRGQNLVDTNIDIDVGLGSLDLTLPENANILISGEHGFLSSFDVYGLNRKNGRWRSDHWDEAYPTITVNVKVGVGSVEIRVRD